jgi:hypothetical protein
VVVVVLDCVEVRRDERVWWEVGGGKVVGFLSVRGEMGRMLCTIQADKKLPSCEIGHCTLGGHAIGITETTPQLVIGEPAVIAEERTCQLHMYHITTHSNNRLYVLL